MTETPDSPPVSLIPAPPSDPEPLKYGSRRNPTRIKAIIALDQNGQTQQQIATTMGITQSAVSQILREWRPLTELAQMKANNLQLEAVESLARAMPAAEQRGKHGPQATLLELGGLIRGHDRGVHVTVTIGAQDTDVEIGVIDIEPVKLT